MNLFRKLLGWLSNNNLPLPETIKPEDYLIKVIPYSKNYVAFQYSVNKGRTFHNVVYCSSPFLSSLEYNYEMKSLISPLNEESIKKKLHELSTYNKLYEFIQKEFIDFQVKKKDWEKRQHLVKTKAQNIIDKLNNNTTNEQS